jgi:uncharacterized membrane protein
MLPLPGINIQQAQHWQGPYPPPDAVERYERVLPGTFDRMLAMAERLQASQIEQSSRALEYNRQSNRRGQWLGFVVTVLAVCGAVACLAYDYPWVATCFLSVPVMAVAKALIETAKAPSSKDLIAAATQQAAAPNPPAGTGGTDKAAKG